MLFLILLFVATTIVHAQIAITTSNDATVLAQKIVGQGVTILNPVYRGNAVSAGLFKDLTGTIGLDSGIALTTGRALTTSSTASSGVGINGAANLRPGFANNSPSDPDLNNLISGNGARQDACVLEFDFIPQGDSIKVKFVFASEEYPTYNCTQYNDVFGFLISGPGINGLQNIALIPNTNIPVSINSINNGIPGGGGNIGICRNLGAGAPFTNLYVDNSRSNYVTYNGLTVILTATAIVQPCQTYHIKLAIQDVIDGLYDSAVFLEASSFSSNGISLINEGGFVDSQNNTVIVEGCKSSRVKINLNRPAATTLSLPITYSGTATPGIDYVALPNAITFQTGEIEKILEILPVLDTNIEPTETIIISVNNTICNNTIANSVKILLKDSIGFYASKDTFVCSKFNTTLTAKKVDTTINTYLWSTGNTNQFIQTNLPNTYWVIHTFSNRCFNIDTFRVVSGDPTLNIGNDIAFCNTDSVLVTATAQPQNGNFLWNTGSTQSSIYVNTAGLFSVTYSLPNGCYLEDTIRSTVKPIPYALLGKDTALCSNESITLNAFYPNATYIWNTGATTASINAKDSGMYTVTNVLNGCTDSDTIFIDRKKSPVANAGNDVAIIIGGTARLRALQATNNMDYLWFPNIALNKTTTYATNANPLTSQTYYLKVTSSDNCIAYDTVLIEVKNIELIIPNAFSPNGDRINDTWEINLLNSLLTAKVQVFNRNGQQVFSSVGYDKPWDGTFNGNPVPSGTYYYVIEIDSKTKNRKTGWVAIIR